jgi:DNA-binding NtrC family response regulator
MSGYNHDLFHLDDSGIIRMAYECELEGSGFSVANGVVLSDLANYLESQRARAYLLDGNFPRFDDDTEDLLAFEAVEMIREKDPQAKIGIMTSQRDLEGRIESIKARFFDKNKTDPKDIAAWLRAA